MGTGHTRRLQPGGATPNADTKYSKTGGEEISRHQALIQNSPAGVLIENEARRVVNVNAKFSEMLGLEAGPEELVGADCSAAAESCKHLFVDPEGFVERLEETLNQRRAIVSEELRLADGRIFERDYVPAFVRDQYRGALWTYRDVTKRERTGELMREADLAMYRAKKEPSHHKAFDPGMDHQLREKLALESQLRQALSEGEFELYYQPKVSLEDGRVAAFEALLRWNNPERGLLLPEDFLPMAEEIGLTVPLGSWVLEEACRQRKEWQDLYSGAESLKMCVNVSGKQLERSGFPEEVSEVLQRNGLEPQALGLELIESTLIGEDETSVEALQRLRDMGVALIIDDFGVGYSSLSYLKRLPVGFLKIDSSFTKGLGTIDAETTVVRALLEISRAYGIKVIAEGVETREQISLLGEMGCDLAQGHYFAGASPPTRATTYLLAGLY